MADLHAAVADYLEFRRSIGFKLDRVDRLLVDFVDYLHDQGCSRVTVEAALAWATAPQQASSWWWLRRLAVVRGFARYLQGIDPDTEVPPTGLIAAVTPRAVPYMYSEQDIAALMNTASGLQPRLRAGTYASLIGLLAVTGMRVSEAINLNDSDVQLDESVIVVRHAKFDKTRELLLHRSAVDALARYRDIRSRHRPQPASEAFFVSTAGTRLLYPNILGVFHQLIDDVGLAGQRNGRRPRLHDFRHRFAVQSVLDGYAIGADIGPRLAALSIYLGHTKPADTYWYLSATPELLGVAAQRLEAALGVQP